MAAAAASVSTRTRWALPPRCCHSRAACSAAAAMLAAPTSPTRTGSGKMGSAPAISISSSFAGGLPAVDSRWLSRSRSMGCLRGKTTPRRIGAAELNDYAGSILYGRDGVQLIQVGQVALVPQHVSALSLDELRRLPARDVVDLAQDQRRHQPGAIVPGGAVHHHALAGRYQLGAQVGDPVQVMQVRQGSVREGELDVEIDHVRAGVFPAAKVVRLAHVDYREGPGVEDFSLQLADAA